MYQIKCIRNFIKSRDISVGIVTTPQARRPSNRVRFPAGAWIFPLFQNVQTGYGVDPTSSLLEVVSKAAIDQRRLASRRFNLSKCDSVGVCVSGVATPEPKEVLVCVCAL
jgi:hypothetical protein